MADYIKINGTDLSVSTGIRVQRIDGLSPLAPMKFDRSRGSLNQEIDSRHIEITFIVQSTTTITSLHSRVDVLAGLVGANGSTRRETAIEFLDGATSIHLLHVIVESFDVNYFDPQGIQLYAQVVMRCLVVSSTDPTGRTTVDTSVSGHALGFRHHLYTNVTNYQTGSGLIFRLTPSVSGVLGVYNLASENDFYLAHAATSSGSIGLVQGLYGLPAISITANATYLRYSIPYAIPLYGTSNAVSAVIRFKRNYALSHATAKYLLDEGSQFRVSIDASTGLLRLTGTGTAVTLSGANVSDIYWNTLIVTVAGSTASMHLYTPGVGTTSASQTDWTTFSTTNAFFYVGNSSAGTNPCQSYIGEVAIYKHDITSYQRDELLTLARPIRETRKLDLCRNLMFLLDFMDGFAASANRLSGFYIQNAITSSETLLIDFERLIAKKFNKTSGVATDVSNEMNFLPNQERRIILGTSNRLMYLVPTSGTVTVNFSYNAGRYR